jgi:hypothetical protein
VDYVFGFARNKRLRRVLVRAMQDQTRAPAHGKTTRVLCEFAYRTKKSWSRARRVVAKAEQIEGKENPRYLVTSLDKEAWPAQKLYERLYCARGEMENGIKEQLSLFADRISRDAAGESVAAGLLLAGLCAGRGLASVGPGGHGAGGSTSRHHPAEAAENRPAGAHYRAPHLGSLQLRVSLAECFRRGLDGTPLLRITPLTKMEFASRSHAEVLAKTASSPTGPSLSTTKTQKRSAAPVPPTKSKTAPPTPQLQLTTGEKSGLVALLEQNHSCPRKTSGCTFRFWQQRKQLDWRAVELRCSL